VLAEPVKLSSYKKGKSMATINITEEKKKKVLELIKSYKAIDSAILPYQEQRKELRKEYIENEWLTNEEVSLVKKAYNAVKSKVDSDDLSSFMDIVKKEMPIV
jgi:predicted nuclease with TOPRIM domain